MIRKLSLVAFVAFTINSSGQTTAKPHWTKEMLGGLTFIMNDPHGGAGVTFKADGQLVPTGQGLGWDVTNPTDLRWEIVNDRLRLTSGAVQIGEWTLISANPKAIRVESSPGSFIDLLVKRSSPGIDRTKAKLQSITLDVNFDKEDIASVLWFLTEKSREIDPDHVGVTFVLELSPAAIKNQGVDRKVAITLDKTPLIELLPYIADQIHLRYEIEENRVVFFAYDR